MKRLIEPRMQNCLFRIIELVPRFLYRMTYRLGIVGILEPAWVIWVAIKVSKSTGCALQLMSQHHLSAPSQLSCNLKIVFSFIWKRAQIVREAFKRAGMI